MELIKSDGNIYVFQLNERKVVIEAENEKQAREELQRIIDIPNEERNYVAELKELLIQNVKQKAKELLSSTDYKVTRHEEQLKIEAKTSLTDIEFQTLLTERNYIRVNSNKFEAEIEKLDAIEDLQDYKIEY